MFEVHRLVELAEFYEVEGYEYWGRNHQDDVLWDDDDDSSDYSDRPNNLTRAEAAYQYPEACHQALAATLGLNYHKIRKAVGETPTSRIANAPKRPAEDMVSNPHVSTRPKPVKQARRLGDVSPTMLQKLVYGVPSVASKSVSSELEDKLVWREGSEISDDALSKLKGLSSDIGSILRAIERGKLHVKSEQMHVSPTESRPRADIIKGESPEAMAVEEETRSPHTVSTEIISPTGSLPDTASMLS